MQVDEMQVQESQEKGRIADQASSYTPIQLYKLGVLYATLARMLPTEGRDYKVVARFEGPDDMMSLSMVPYTELGRLWCEYCEKELRRK
jgi:hypothetical protein